MIRSMGISSFVLRLNMLILIKFGFMTVIVSIGIAAQNGKLLSKVSDRFPLSCNGVLSVGIFCILSTYFNVIYSGTAR